MRILFVSSSTSKQSGAELCLFKLAEHFRDHCVVVLPNEEGIAQAYKEAGISVEVIPMVRMRRSGSIYYQIKYLFSIPFSIIRLSILFKKKSADLVHVNEFVEVPALLAAKIVGIPTVCHVRFTVKEPVILKKFLLWLVIILSDQIVCVSQSVRNSMLLDEQSKVIKASVVYDGGPDLNVFNPSIGEKRVIREEFGVDQETFIIGLVSKFVPVKGHMHLVQVAKYLSDIGEINFRCLLVGGVVQGHEEYYSDVESMVQKNDLEDRIIFTGFQDNIPSVLNACDVVVHLPLYDDPFPGVVLEAMAMAKPVVAYRNGGIPEQIEDGVSGFLIEEGDIERLANTILMLARNPKTLEKIGHTARQQLLNNFSLDDHISQITNIYSSVLNSLD